MPLAIELAAARIDVFGVKGVASRVGDLLRLLTGRRRSAPARHKTIMMGAAKHFLGDQISARRHLEQVLTHPAGSDDGQPVIRIQDSSRLGTDLRVSARAFLARVLWVQGLPDQAVRTAEMSIGEAQATGHTLSLCYALAFGACRSPTKNTDPARVWRE